MLVVHASTLNKTYLFIYLSHSLGNIFITPFKIIFLGKFVTNSNQYCNINCPGYSNV